MPTWASLALVRSRVSYATIDATSKPTQDEVTSFLNAAEARLRAVLAASGLASTYDAGSDAALILAEWATDYAVGQCRKVWGEHADGDKLLAAFEDVINKLRDRAIQLGSELAGGDVPERAAGVRSTWTDNNDGESIAAGDFEPEITRDWKD